MQVICSGALEAPKAGAAKGPVRSSAQNTRKYSIMNIKALTTFLEEVMGSTAENCLVLYAHPEQVSAQISCTMWV